MLLVKRSGYNLRLALSAAALAFAAFPAAADIMVPVNRSTLVTLPAPMAEVMVANPEIADVHAHNPSNLTLVGKQVGRTSVRIFGKDEKILREFDVTVGYDLPAIRRALKNFLPDERIGVEMVNTSVALTGQISNAAVADKAIKITSDFILADLPKEEKAAFTKAKMTELEQGKESSDPYILNMMQVISGQQVMLRVRVGEINREALKTLGIDLNVINRMSGSSLIALGTGTGLAGLSSTGTPGSFALPADANVHGTLIGRWQPDGTGGDTVSGMLKALERDGLFKLLAEPNLVAVSGEEADFLAGGEIPVPVVQGGSGSTFANISIEYKPFGVAVKFTPFVLTENRIRMMVQPEVSEISTTNAVRVSGFDIPSISTRRAKTTVEMAPGESFMIAGLIKDQMRATIDQMPGVKELPVLGALFRSTEFQRDETELVIAVTPYIVDPVKSSDVKLPTDDFRPASQMEMFFYGALGSLGGNVRTLSQTPLEGPVGFMVD